MSALASTTKAIALAGGIVLASSANAGFIPFYLDNTGGGTPATDGGTVLEFEQLNVNGAVQVEDIVFTSPTTYNFAQSADFTVNSASEPTFGLCLGTLCNFTATLSGAVGSADLVSGAATFTGGTITVTDVFNTIDIATFDIVDGGVGVDNTGVPQVQNNESSILADATFFAPGYFFLDELGADDFADLDLGNDPGQFNLDLFVNLTLSNIVPTFEGAEGQEILTEITFDAAGQARFQVVPAPATLALFSLGLLGLGAAARRKRAA